MKTAEDIILDKDSEMVCISRDSTVHEALGVMTEKKIGAILVKSGEEIVGIWTERDLMRNVVSPGFDMKSTRMGEVMSSPVHATPHDTPLIKLEEQFLGLFIRHILVEKDDKPIGMLSIGDVVRASLLEKDQQIRELNSMASWQYYENWSWDRKKKR